MASITTKPSEKALGWCDVEGGGAGTHSSLGTGDREGPAAREGDGERREETSQQQDFKKRSCPPWKPRERSETSLTEGLRLLR